MNVSAGSLVCVIVAGVSGVMGGELSPAATDCPGGSAWNGLFCAPDEDEPGDDQLTTTCHQSDPLVLNVPCRIGDYQFAAAPLDCYIRDISDDVPAGDPRWEGHPPGDGAVYRCAKLTAVGQGGQPAWGPYRDFWAADAPGEQPVVVVEPEEVAEEIVEGMRFEPLAIGLAPRALEEDPASIGLVGAPVWMWVTNAGPSTWGPVRETATVGGVTVTVTAEVESVTWEMGDGGRVTCEEPGVAYEARLGVRASPDCGYLYEQTSGDRPGTAYTVTATANWLVTWAASSGETGTLEGTRPTTAAQVRIGERQVIETG